MTNSSHKERKSIGHDAAWVLAGRVGTVLLQGAYFVLLARLLGVSEYGVFAGAFALASTIAPYSALGNAMLFMRYLAPHPELAPKYWGNSLITTLGFTLASVLAVVFVRLWHGKLAHMGIILVLLVASCLFLQVTTLGSTLIFVLGDARMSAALNLLSNLCRVLAVILMSVTLTHADAFQWSLGVLAASAVAAALAYSQVRHCIGPAHYDFDLVRRRALEGLGFSFAGTTEAVNNDIDKVMFLITDWKFKTGSILSPTVSWTLRRVRWLH
jgi:O-antigen/teichoic acid export membrane protein